MCATCDQLDDLCIVRDVRKAEARFAVGHDVEQVESSARRHVARLDQTADLRGARLRIGTHRFLFLRRESAFCVAGCETAVAHDAIVFGCFRDAGFDRSAELGRDRALRHDALAADELTGLFENTRRVRSDELVEAAADGWIRREAARAIRSAAHGTDDEILDRDRYERSVCSRFQVTNGFEPGVDAADRAARLLYHEQLDGSAARFDRSIERLAIEAFAA